MKGTPERARRAGSPRAPSRALQALDARFAAVDILPDPRIRQELSALSQWPTIPQLFVRGELVGGCDIVTEMFETRRARRAARRRGRRGRGPSRRWPRARRCRSRTGSADATVAAPPPRRSPRGVVSGPMPVAIVTDSTHYTTRELIAAAGSPRGQPVRRGRRRQPARERDRRLRRVLRAAARRAARCRPPRSRRSATSSPPTSRCSPAGNDIVSIHLAGGISGTVGAAAQAQGAARRAPRRRGRIEVIDARTACGGLGLRRARRGGGRARRRRRSTAVLARAQEARAALRIWFCIDTLAYLQRGGRIGRAQAWLGGALQVKPILSLEAEITPVERVRTAGPGVRADGRLHAQPPRRAAPTAGSSSTSRRPSAPPRWSSAAASCSAASRSGSRRSGR